MDNQILTDTKDRAVVEGLKKAAEALKNTITTVQADGVSVTITAEPAVVDIQIAPNADIRTLPDTLKRCFNEAFQRSLQKVLERAVNESVGEGEKKAVRQED